MFCIGHDNNANQVRGERRGGSVAGVRGEWWMMGYSGCRGSRLACAGRPAPPAAGWTCGPKPVALDPGVPLATKCCKGGRCLAIACRRGARCSSGNRLVSVCTWPPGRMPHRRSGRSIAAPAHLESLSAPGVRARLCWSITCAAPAPPRVRRRESCG